MISKVIPQYITTYIKRFYYVPPNYKTNKTIGYYNENKTEKNDIIDNNIINIKLKIEKIENDISKINDILREHYVVLDMIRTSLSRFNNK